MDSNSKYRVPETTGWRAVNIMREAGFNPGHLWGRSGSGNPPIEVDIEAVLIAASKGDKRQLDDAVTTLMKAVYKVGLQNGEDGL